MYVQCHLQSIVNRLLLMVYYILYRIFDLGPIKVYDMS